MGNRAVFSYRCYLNGNVHVKFNIEFSKALNVAVGKKLGWLRSTEDIKKEFTPEMAKGAETYFNAFAGIPLTVASNMLLTND